MSNPPPDLAGLPVLAVFAHPDDEGFGCGGTLAMLVARGARVTLVCATNGDVGEISDPSLATPQTLAMVRQEELRRAMAVTGIEDLRFLGYRDSGMAGSPDNLHQDSLLRAAPDQVAARLAGIIREVRPEAVITHDPTGGYGHPDHKTVHQRVTRAVSLARDPAYGGPPARGLPSWSPRLLYYMCLPRSNFRRMWQQMLDAGITPPFASESVETLGTPDEEVTTTLDVSAFVETKIASLACHRTQIGPNGPFSRLPQALMNEIMSTEYYTLAASGGVTGATDLLAGLV